jgi:hypothetical protein
MKTTIKLNNNDTFDSGKYDFKETEMYGMKGIMATYTGKEVSRCNVFIPFQSINYICVF